VNAIYAAVRVAAIVRGKNDDRVVQQVEVVQGIDLLSNCSIMQTTFWILPRPPVRTKSQAQRLISNDRCCPASKTSASSPAMAATSAPVCPVTL
jgi:hypothetical protein